MTTCPLCAEALAPGMTRCPHCGESFVLPPLPSAGKRPLPPAVRTLARGLLLLAALRTAGFVQLLMVLAQHSMFDPWTLVAVCAPQVGHTALVVAAGVGLLQARSWAPIVAWLHAALTLFWFGSYLLSFLGIGFGPGGFGLDFGTVVFLLSLGLAAATVVVLARPEVRAAFRSAR